MNITAITGMDISYILAQMPEELMQEVTFTWHKKTSEALDSLAETDVLVMTGLMNPSILEKTPKLRWVQSLSAGVDKLPLTELKERNVLVTNMSGVHPIQMSEFTLSLMLQWVRKTNLLLINQSKRIWDHTLTFGELYGKTLGILGAGAIGEAVAKKARAFDMQVIGLNRSGASVPHFDEMLSGEEGLTTLLRESDFLVVLLPSTAKTKHFLQKRHFEIMKPEAFLINLARGDVIVESDLIDALRQNRIAGAALDVFEKEPLPVESPLWGMEQVIATPHIGGSSAQYIKRAAPIFYHNIRQFLAGRPLLNIVDLEEGY